MTQNENDSKHPALKWLNKYGLNTGLILALSGSILTGAHFLGKLDERVMNTQERIKRLEDQMDGQIEAIIGAKNEAIAELKAQMSRQDDPVIFTDGQLTSGYNMGVNTANEQTDWVEINNGAMCMVYPGNQTWGAVFITVGEPSDPPHPTRDLSNYQLLSIEIRGDNGGESVEVGLKDNVDPDDGSETKFLIENLTTEWDTVEIPLSSFRTADLERLYIVTEFIFQRTPQTVCVRKIQFLK